MVCMDANGASELKLYAINAYSIRPFVYPLSGLLTRMLRSAWQALLRSVVFLLAYSLSPEFMVKRLMIMICLRRFHSLLTHCATIVLSLKEHRIRGQIPFSCGVKFSMNMMIILEWYRPSICFDFVAARLTDVFTSL